MASGHGYRANRPNTWLLRPLLQSEDSSCQPGAVHTWPKANVAERDRDVRFQGVERTSTRARGLSANGPGCVETQCRCYDSLVILRGI